MSNRRQRGAAMVTSMIVLSGLLVAAGASVYLLTAETKSTSFTASSRRSLFCAEAGLAAARNIVARNHGGWNAALDVNTADPAWYPITGYLEANGSGPPDFTVTLKDNDDELPPLDNEPNRDNDLRVFIVSRCDRYPEHPRTVMELVEYSSAGHTYRHQGGQGGNNSGNTNTGAAP
jgi:hypothetical protein